MQDCVCGEMLGMWMRLKTISQFVYPIVQLLKRSSDIHEHILIESHLSLSSEILGFKIGIWFLSDAQDALKLYVFFHGL